MRQGSSQKLSLAWGLHWGVSKNVTHVYFGGLSECPHWVDVIVEDDDSHHYPHAEEEGLSVSEPAAIFPVGKPKRNVERTGSVFLSGKMPKAINPDLSLHHFKEACLPGRRQPFPAAFTAGPSALNHKQNHQPSWARACRPPSCRHSWGLSGKVPVV